MSHSKRSAIGLFAFLGAVLVALILFAVFDRPDPAVKIPDPYNVQPLVEAHEDAKAYVGGVTIPPAVATEATTVAHEATPPVVEKKPAKKAAKKAGLSDEEKKAWVTGYLSAARARCLEIIVDRKIAYDIEDGQINDFGDAREAPICRDVQVLIGLAQSGIEAGALLRPPKQ